MSPTPGGPAAAEQERRVPGLITTYNRQSREIVIADEERVIVEHLSAGGLVVGVIQADQGVAQEWRELAARVGDLLRRLWRLDDLHEGAAGLQFGLAIIVESAC